MRTNIDLDDALIRDAMRLSRARTKKAIVEEALRAFISVRTAEKRAESYSDRFRALEKKLSAVRLRRSPSKILREDRDRI